MTVAISATGVEVRVKSARLLNDVGIHASAGELVAIIGPNGAGKSTLVSVLAGDRQPTAGHVTLGGEDIHDLDVRELARRRAVFSGSRDTTVPFSVRDVVEMGRHSVDGAPDAQTAAEAMAAMDVSQLADRVVGSLSGGERTRVDLARLLVQDAPVVLLDEPLGALDVAHEERVMAHLSSLTLRGKAIVAVLHDLNAAAAFADRIIVLKRGIVAAQGRVGEVFRSEVLSPVYEYPLIVHNVEDRLVVVPSGRASRGR